MTNQLTGRKERLSWLIGFINENAVLYKVCHHDRGFLVRMHKLTAYRCRNGVDKSLQRMQRNYMGPISCGLLITNI